MSDALQSLSRFIPELILMGALAVVIVADLITQRRPLKSSTDLLNGITLVGLFAALVTSWQALGTVEAQSLFASMLADDGLLGVFRPIFCLTSIVVLLLGMRSKELEGVRLGEMLALLLTVTAALMWMAGSVNLVMIYLSLETVSVASYLMVGYLSSDRLSNEASLKYILFGAVSTGAMLFGLSLLYGMTGTLDLYGVRAALAEGAFGPGLLFVLILIAAGIGFKIAAAPFHFWCPDVYTGAPTPVTAFLSVGPKAAGFAVLIRFFYLGMAEPAGGGALAPVGGADWQMLLMMLAVITMTLGNVAALLQTNVKRLLAYSSIAHAGTMLMAACVLSVEGVQAIAAYLAIYLFMNLGAFAVVILAHRVTGSFEIGSYAGFWKRSPLLTVAMGIFLFSLMGIPPFAGFLAKWYVFAAVINAGLGWLAVIGVLNAAVAAFYYVKVLRVMVIDQETGPTPALAFSRLDLALLVLLVVPNVLGLLFWGSLDRVTEYSQTLLELG